MYEFEAFPKIPRFKREIVVTEKIDGTNAQIAWAELKNESDVFAAHGDPNCLKVVSGQYDGESPMALYAGSRNRWVLPGKQDNFGFAAWAWEHAVELMKLGPGRHFGEWYGLGIQRGYGLSEKRFALFNVARWGDEWDPAVCDLRRNGSRPACCDVAPVVARGTAVDLDRVMWELGTFGSKAVPGFKSPEGIVIYHTASRQMYKRTFEQDGGKWKDAA